MLSKPFFKSVLITGSTSGIGKELVSFFKKKNLEVFTASRTDPSLPVDLSNSSQRQAVLDLISQKKPDLIINNAGLGYYGPTLTLSIEEQQNIIALNCSALMEISIHSAKVLLAEKKPGTILNISSIGAFFPFPTFNVYCASKAFVNQFSLALNAELSKSGIAVLCACPGQIDTNFRARAAKGYPQQKDWMTMSVETAVKHLWKQILKNKRLYIFDWRARLFVFFSKWLPQKMVQRLLEKKLSRRYAS